MVADQGRTAWCRSSSDSSPTRPPVQDATANRIFAALTANVTGSFLQLITDSDVPADVELSYDDSNTHLMKSLRANLDHEIP